MPPPPGTHDPHLLTSVPSIPRARVRRWVGRDVCRELLGGPKASAFISWVTGSGGNQAPCHVDARATRPGERPTPKDLQSRPGGP